MGPSPQTLSVDDRRRVAAWAADCAEHALGIFEDAAPDDRRVEDAIAQARAFARGDLDVADAIRTRGGDAGAAARDAPTPAARAAAYAAEQAAACAHMGAHALGAAGYAAKALALAANAADRDDALDRACHEQMAMMDESVVDALAALPMLATNPSGPLARGRLSSGAVGHAIRTIQTEVAARAGRDSNRERGASTR